MERCEWWWCLSRLLHGALRQYSSPSSSTQCRVFVFIFDDCSCYILLLLRFTSSQQNLHQNKKRDTRLQYCMDNTVTGTRFNNNNQQYEQEVIGRRFNDTTLLIILHKQYICILAIIEINPRQIPFALFLFRTQQQHAATVVFLIIIDMEASETSGTVGSNKGVYQRSCLIIISISINISIVFMRNTVVGAEQKVSHVHSSSSSSSSSSNSQVVDPVLVRRRLLWICRVRRLSTTMIVVTSL
mmetsp:Transcript_50404/g.51265  ORF Transcript_50404/g.51265 Transcript_50404/m.51265 type:complete len:242 (+) Transcript_50404:214-939(+)